MENFNLKEIVKQTIRELATEEMIEYQIRSAVKECFNYKINEEIRAAAMEYVHEKGEGYIREKVDEIMNGHVWTDDGWGNVKDHGTFENYVRKAIREKCMSQWNVEREVKKAVDEKIKKFCEEVKCDNIEEASEKVLGRIAAQYAAKEVKP